jgi:hypothetical protein
MPFKSLHHADTGKNEPGGKRTTRSEMPDGASAASDDGAWTDVVGVA